MTYTKPAAYQYFPQDQAKSVMAKKTPTPATKKSKTKQALPIKDESLPSPTKAAASSEPEARKPAEPKAAPGKGAPRKSSAAATAKAPVRPQPKAAASKSPASGAGQPLAQGAVAEAAAPEAVPPSAEKAVPKMPASKPTSPAPATRASTPQTVLSTPPASAPESKAPVPEASAAISAGQKEEAGKVRARVFPSESECVASLPPLPTPDMRPESLEEEIFAEHSNLPPVTEPVPESDWEPVSVAEPGLVPGPQPEYFPQAPSIPSLFVVQITPELAPVAKVGGLADVVFGLSSELEIRGNHVEIILPKYDCLRYDHIWGLCETYADLWVPWYGGAIHCTVFFGFVHGRKCFFIEPHSADNFFNRGCIYGFNDDVLRFAFFTRAAMEFLWKSGKQPDIIHCHDWQTALAPLFLYEIYQHLGMNHPRVCFTIHNFKHQGVTGAQLLHATGLNRPEYYFHYDRLRDNHNPHALNLMKAGVVYANFVTTVSPRHALEAKDQGQGFGLEPTLHIHHQKYGGVVNGIDYAFWNPELDPYIPFRYNLDSIDEKYRDKRALRERLLIADNEKPIVAFVGRLDPQKGLELIRHALFSSLQRGGQFVLLGSSPDGQINNYFWSLKHQFNDHPDCHIEIGFNEELSHLIYAGADLVIVPSRFEPCGLTQLIAMRYGTIPVVREIGGLADTVFDKDFSHKPLHERNGYVFRDYDEKGLDSALGRAISCFYEYPEHFRELMKNAMRTDYSWKNPGQDYLNIFDHIRDK